jgi:hypothetical protein
VAVKTPLAGRRLRAGQAFDLIGELERGGYRGPYFTSKLAYFVLRIALLGPKRSASNSQASFSRLRRNHPLDFASQ